MGAALTLHVDALPVAKLGRRFSVFAINGDACARTGVEFQHELIAVLLPRGRFDDAAAEDHHFVKLGVELRRGTRPVMDFADDAGCSHAREAGCQREPAGASPECDKGQDE